MIDTNKIKELVERWNNKSPSKLPVSRVLYDVTHNVIRFSTTSGPFEITEHSLSGKYLEDDTDLEKDAQKYWGEISLNRLRTSGDDKMYVMFGNNQ